MMAGIVAGGMPVSQGSLGEMRVAVTVAAQAEAMTGFPVYIDLSTMPSEFWSGRLRRDGRDVRVKTAAGADIPMHLVRFDIGASGGSLFARVNLLSGAPTTFYIHWGSSSNSAVADNASNGAFALWADYHRVFLFNASTTDFSGSGTSAIVNGRTKAFEKIGERTGLSEHQGICWDGSHYYVTDTNVINKYDANWVLVASNSNPTGDVGYGTNHCGDPDVHNGVLYVPVESYTNITTFSNQRIARFNTSNLSLIDSVSVSAQADEVASIAVDPEAGHLYTANFSDSTIRLQKYNLETLAWIATVNGSAAFTKVQGITRWRGSWFANGDTTDTTARLPESLAAAGAVWTDILDSSTTRAGNYEGLGKRDDDLLVLRDDTASSTVHIIRPLKTEAGGGVEIINGAAGVGHIISPSVTNSGTFTIGVSAAPDVAGASNQAFVSYTKNQTANTDRVTIGYRASSGKFGMWDTGNSWMESVTAAASATKRRLHGRYNGTTSRALFVDGVKEATASGIVAAPANKTTLMIGAEDTSLAEPFDGKIGLVYLRASALSDAWIAAECANLMSPAAFYSVGISEGV